MRLATRASPNDMSMILMFVAASVGETRFDENEDLYCHYMRSCSTASISDVVRTVSAQVPAVWCRSHFSSSGPRDLGPIYKYISDINIYNNQIYIL